MIIDNKLFVELLQKAMESPRLRMNFDLRTSSDDKSQRMLNAILPGSVIPIHRHRESTETIVCLMGKVTEIFYNDDGVECGRFELSENGETKGLQIPLRQWHTIIAEVPSVIFEAKDGEYKPLTSEDVWNYE